MKAVAIIANPKAGAGLALQKLREARRMLWGRQYDFFIPESPEEMARICAGLSPSRYDAVVVMGGDGTVNLAIRELARSPSSAVPLYPFPVGTANDLASEMGTTLDWAMVEDLIHARSIERIDLIRVNGIPFATVAGIGIGASLTSELNAKREHSRILKFGLKQLRSPIYSVLTFKIILTQRNLNREYLLDSGHLRQKIKASALFISNQGRLGGNLQVANREDNTDNRFSVLVATASSRIQLITALAQLQRGQIPASFLLFSTDFLAVESTDRKPISVFGDGETLVEASKLEFDIHPRSLPVFKSRTRRIDA